MGLAIPNLLCSLYLFNKEKKYETQYPQASFAGGEMFFLVLRALAYVHYQYHIHFEHFVRRPFGPFILVCCRPALLVLISFCNKMNKIPTKRISHASLNITKLPFAMQSNVKTVLIRQLAHYHYLHVCNIQQSDAVCYCCIHVNTATKKATSFQHSTPQGAEYIIFYICSFSLEF